MARNTTIQLQQQMVALAKKYYQRDDLRIESADDLRKLSPRQLNNITNWATNTDPDSKARIRGNKYTGNTYGKLKRIY